jgi:hypothetical protein
VDLSLDGGQSWATVWQQTGFTSATAPVTIPVPQAAGQRDVRVRFHFTASWDFWWSIDNVFIGTQKCAATPGSLVDGIVTDANTGHPLDGATVASGTAPGSSGVSGPTGDPAVPGGFYWLFASPPGSTQLTAGDGEYAPASQTVDIAASTVIHRDWPLRRPWAAPRRRR